MNENMQNAITNVINKALQSAEAAEGFIVEQTPEVVQQLLTWHMAHSLLWFGFGVFLAVVTVTVILAGARKAESTGDDDYYVIGGGTGSVSGLLSFIFMSGNLDWLKILVAPKVYLLEYAAQLVK